MAKTAESKTAESKTAESKTAESKTAESKKLSVVLKCRYGNYMPNDKVLLPKDEAQRLLSLDVAKKV